jgi:hypothetical protein
MWICLKDFAGALSWKNVAQKAFSLEYYYLQTKNKEVKWVACTFSISDKTCG